MTAMDYAVMGRGTNLEALHPQTLSLSPWTFNPKPYTVTPQCSCPKQILSTPDFGTLEVLFQSSLMEMRESLVSLKN